ncbi:Beta-ketoadipate enol-lactone hydrolase [Rhodovulum sp. PH10]|uniref:3-oxoadipate enol-lactonase n=1 Tax=Rhodovulum sp. PH10 TaxID=1187851 RepID=UPI00027C2544|nr:3-oxoadipate enol-lactonase [Rhodovulum sp. PH10]EJW11340.1 Beta-ketoadipate enol-lactone hydrolase [Rhodovulum sp. PH10]
MPIADVNGVALSYTVDGAADRPVLLFSNSLGTSADMWAWQLPALLPHFRIVRYDTRGHGRSAVPEGDYDFDLLAQDAEALLTHLGVRKAHVCGLSMGGPTAMRLALRRPDLVDRLVLCNTAARIGSAQGWSDRIAAVAARGLATMAPELVERWVSDGFREKSPALAWMLVDMLRRTPDAGYVRNCAALRDGDLTAEVPSISAPTLVISGSLDAATTTAQAAELAARLPNARHIDLVSSHISNWEQPEAFSNALLQFLRPD